jgi:hypothetical protein
MYLVKASAPGVPMAPRRLALGESPGSERAEQIHPSFNPFSYIIPTDQLIGVKTICQSLAIMLLLAGCGFFGGNEEVSQSRPGHTVYRATC